MESICSLGTLEYMLFQLRLMAAVLDYLDIFIVLSIYMYYYYIRRTPACCMCIRITKSFPKP